MGRPVCRGPRPVSHEERILVAEGPSDGRCICLRIQHSTLASTCARREVEFIIDTKSLHETCRYYLRSFDTDLKTFILCIPRKKYSTSDDSLIRAPIVRKSH